MIKAIIILGKHNNNKKANNEQIFKSIACVTTKLKEKKKEVFSDFFEPVAYIVIAQHRHVSGKE